MNAKSTRPQVAPGFNLDSLMVTAPAMAAPATEAVVETKAANTASAKGESEMFRTSVVFHRAVHDKLRAIAFEERCNVTDLINEGLDHVLSKRNYPTTTELRRGKA